MIRRLVTVISFMLLVAGCQVSEAEAPSAPDGLLDARDTAFAYVQLRYVVGIAPSIGWDEDQIISDDLGDWVEYQYSSLPWLATIGGPSGDADGVDYDVVITNPNTGFLWEGRVAPDGSVVEGGEQVLAACDATCDYLSDRFSELGFSGLEWSGRRVTPEGLVGSETYEYTASDWTLTVTFPVVAPDAVTYHVAVENADTGFVWEGEMDADRHLTETNAYSRVPGADGA